jgi:hypothetical protein
MNSADQGPYRPKVPSNPAIAGSLTDRLHTSGRVRTAPVAGPRPGPGPVGAAWV